MTEPENASDVRFRSRVWSVLRALVFVCVIIFIWEGWTKTACSFVCIALVMGWVNHTPNLERRVPKFCMADISTSFFWTSNVSVERKYLIEAGLFDEDFKEYGWEDLELGRRLKKLGLKRIFNFKAIVFHYKGHWKKEDLPRLIKQAKAKARTAIIFMEKDPSFVVKLSTAVYPPRLFLNKVMNWKDKGIAFCEKVLAKQKEGVPLKGFALMCAQNLVSFHYFAEIEKEMKKSKE